MQLNSETSAHLAPPLKQKSKIWHFDPATAPTTRQKTLNKGQQYQLLEATETDEQKAVENICNSRE